ncbi:MAG: sugar phosphate nucleotidyltransferase [Acidobacteriota bacterium]
MGLHCVTHDKIIEGTNQIISRGQISRHLWAIILAGGNGKRIQTLTHRWKGRHVPKQYCAFVGSRTMLEHTIDRANMLVSPKRQKILIASEHQQEARSHLNGYWPGRVIVQPKNCDTLPGIFLPITYVHKHDRSATVIVYPTDHFIYPKSRFAQAVSEAVSAVEALPDLLMLIGAPADSPEQDYGWIYPGSEIWSSGTYKAYTVRRFLEKPLRADAVDAMEHGGLWNTFIIVVKVETLWQLGWNYFPEPMSLFEHLRNSIGSCREGNVLEAIYEAMPSKNFSTELLTPAVNRIGVLPMNGVVWSDWGREGRIVETLANIGKLPNFPCTLRVPNRERVPGREYASSK